jgi:hypothetical protein
VFTQGLVALLIGIVLGVGAKIAIDKQQSIKATQSTITTNRRTEVTATYSSAPLVSEAQSTKAVRVSVKLRDNDSCEVESRGEYKAPDLLDDS